MSHTPKTSILLAWLVAACVPSPTGVRAEPMNGALMRTGPFAVDQGATPESWNRSRFDPAEEPAGGLIAGGQDVAQAIAALSRQTERAIAACYLDTPDCVADALDVYAAGLEELAPELPARMQSLPRIVATAARRVRNAETKAEAVQAVKIALAAVHKTLVLIKAEDLISRKVESREGAFVAETLQVADNKLERAVGL